MQAGEDHLSTRHPFVRVQVHRHATAVVSDLKRTVLEHHDLDSSGITGDRFVYGVVDHLLSKVVRASGVGVHARTLAYGVQSAQNFD
jgi:hypothetical protein